MRRVLLLLSFVGFAFVYNLTAQVPAVAAANAQAKYDEERYRSLEDKVIKLLEDQAALYKRQEKLDERLRTAEEEILKLRRDQARTPTNLVTQDQLKKVTEQLQDVENNRAKGQDELAKSIKGIKELVLNPPSTPERPTTAAPPVDVQTEEYTVKQRNETLSEIVKKYNEVFKEKTGATITMADVVAVNPGLNPNQIFVGKKILIPWPAKKGQK